jgi:hypothetical protein
MTTKLVSMNLGCRLTIEIDGEQKIIEFSEAGAKQPREILGQLHAFVMEQLEMKYMRDTVSIAKSKRLKRPRSASQEQFNKKIKALGYQP